MSRGIGSEFNSFNCLKVRSRAETSSELGLVISLQPLGYWRNQGGPVARGVDEGIRILM